MVGVPLFAGFISKLYFATAAMETLSLKMIAAMIALAISTILNALYFIRAVISIYTPRNEKYEKLDIQKSITFPVAVICFIALNFLLGIGSDPLIRAIEKGLTMFG